MIGAAPSLRVEQSVAIIGAKGSGGFAKAKAPKTRKSRRTLPLHPAAVDALGAWLASEELGALVGHRDLKPENYLFPGAGGVACRPRSADHIRGDLKALGLPTEIDGQVVCFKSTRSSFASWLEEAGVSEAIRKRLMGHVPKDVTEKHYTRRELGRLAEAVATIALSWERAAEHAEEAQATQEEDGRAPSNSRVLAEADHDRGQVLGLCRGASMGGAGDPGRPCRPGTRPTGVTAGTTGQAKCSESEAPPAGIGPATFGLGSPRRSSEKRPRISWRAVEASVRLEASKGFCSSNGFVKYGRRGPFVVPAEIS